MLYTEGKITGKGFLTHADREAGVNLQVFGPILVVPDGCESWLSRNGLTAISKSDAQTKYNTFIDAKIASYEEDAKPEYTPEQWRRTEPVRETLP